MNTADNGHYIKNTLTVHYTKNEVGTPYRRVRTVCGQSHRRSYFGVHDTPLEVNCQKCLAR